MFRQSDYRPLSADSTEDGSDIAEKEPPKFSWKTIIPKSLNIYTALLCLSIFNLAALLLGFLYHVEASAQRQQDPQIAVLANGTYSGRYDNVSDQFQFLGMPYALPPLGHLRFRLPQHLNYTWDDIRNATDYSPMCIGYRGKSSWYPNGEDCLTINVIKPAAAPVKDLLPVVVYIYGGGAHGGGSRDGRYNMTMLVSHAARHNMSFIAVTFNYRSSIWGFIGNEEILATMSANLGLRDQRLALEWIQENIAAFGGDPKKVTLMGGSSGADNVGRHLVAFGGRDDGLFRAAILQSGSSMDSFGFKETSAQESYDRLVSSTACSDAENPLECLRHLPFEELNSLFDRNNSSGVTVNMAAQSVPAFDGDFIQAYGSSEIKHSRFVKVPIIIGVTSNEGYESLTPEMSSWEDLKQHLLFAPEMKYPRAMVERLLSFYPEDPNTEPLVPAILGFNDLSTYNRITQLLGDLAYNAAKRLQCDAYSRAATCYSYRFDAIERLSTGNQHEGPRHGAEIGPVFQNFDGLGYEQDRSIFEGRSPGFFEMSRVIGLMWAGFITQLDPNAAFDGEPWPKYSVDDPKNIVFNETGPYWIEEDTVRRDATDYIISVQQAALHV